MQKSKLVEGYLNYMKNSDDPNLKACVEKHGEKAIFYSIDAWKKETRPEDRDVIPEKELARSFSKRKNR